MRLEIIRPGSTAPRVASPRFATIPPVPRIQRLVFRHCSLTPPATPTLPSVLMPGLTFPLAATTLISAMPASPVNQRQSGLAPGKHTRILLSRGSVGSPCRQALQSLSIPMAIWGPPLPRRATRTQFSRWIRRAKPSIHSNRSHSVTRKNSIRKASSSSDSSPRK